MVKYFALDQTFGALADPTRRAMLSRLAGGEATITELARPFPVSLPAVSKHVRILERAGLVGRRKVGREYRCHLRPRALREAEAWIRHYRRFWESQLDSLGRYLEKSPQENK